ncbi:MAG: hypothetical protein ACLFPD_05320 [Desulfosudaceae bacterium]
MSGTDENSSDKKDYINKKYFIVRDFCFQNRRSRFPTERFEKIKEKIDDACAHRNNKKINACDRELDDLITFFYPSKKISELMEKYDLKIGDNRTDWNQQIEDQFKQSKGLGMALLGIGAPLMGLLVAGLILTFIQGPPFAFGMSLVYAVLTCFAFCICGLIISGLGFFVPSSEKSPLLAVAMAINIFLMLILISILLQ